MKNWILILVLTIACVACGKKPATSEVSDPKKSPQFRAAQKQKAIKAYQDLVQKYPDSPFAEQARERLKELQPPQ